MSFVAWVAAVLIMVGGAVPGIPTVAAPESPTSPIVHEMVVEPLYNGAGEMIQPGAAPSTVEEMDRRRWSYIIATLQELTRTERAEHLRTTMQRYGCETAFTACARLIVDLAEETAMDPRLCVATAWAESCGGADPLAHGDLFGAKGGIPSIGGWSAEAQVRWYFGRIKEISDEQGFAGDVWRLAWFWNEGGSDNEKARRYADGVTQQVQAIPWPEP